MTCEIVNHRISAVGRDLWASSSPPALAQSRVSWSRVETSQPLWVIHSSVWTPWQWNWFFLMFEWNFLYFRSCPLLLRLLLGTTEKSLAKVKVCSAGTAECREKSLSHQGYSALLSLALLLTQKAAQQGSLSLLWQPFFTFFLVSLRRSGFGSFSVEVAKVRQKAWQGSYDQFSFVFCMHKLCSFSYSSFPVSIKRVTCDGIKISWHVSFHTVCLMYSIINTFFFL